MTSTASISPLGPYSATFACPSCRGPLTEGAGSLRCEHCDSSYLASDGSADFAPTIAPPPGFAPMRLQDPLIASRYETCSRPAFFRIMGGNWEAQLTYSAEVEYLRSALSDVAGPVLDLACGAGSWTRAIADIVGVGNVIALDISKPLLKRCRVSVPDIVAIRGSALSLPFCSSSLGAVVCWNSLQQIPSPEVVIAEVGRCLRDGGVFALLTYRESDEPTARYFQRRHEAAFGVRAFTVDEIRAWLTDAGLTVRERSGPGSFLLLTARREG